MSEPLIGRGALALWGAVTIATASCQPPPARIAPLDTSTTTPAELGRADARGIGRDRSTRDGQLVPFSMQLTVNRIPAEQNGSQPFTARDDTRQTFRLALPRSGFTIDLTWSGGAVDERSLSVSLDRELGGGAAKIPAGDELAGHFDRSDGRASWRVPAQLAAPPGTLRIRASILDGTTRRERELTVTTHDKTVALDPFRLDDLWLIVFGRDDYTVSSALRDGEWLVESRRVPNGQPDFAEDLRAVGLATSTMRDDAAQLSVHGLRGSNAIVERQMRDAIIAATRRAFELTDGSHEVSATRIHMIDADDLDAPPVDHFSPQTLSGDERVKAFSMISLGGGDSTRSLLGRSRTIDIGNRGNEANVGPDFGVFTSAALALIARTAAANAGALQLLRLLIGPFVPELGSGGVRIGESPLDAEILAEDFDPATASQAAADRHRRLTVVIDLLATLAGSLTAHEIGHAVGLVAPGPPPHGLFGGEHRAEFVEAARTTDGHIDTPGFNLMEAGPGSAPQAPLDITKYLTTPRFNALNSAYLHGRLLLLPR